VQWRIDNCVWFREESNRGNAHAVAVLGRSLHRKILVCDRVWEQDEVITVAVSTMVKESSSAFERLFQYHLSSRWPSSFFRIAASMKSAASSSFKARSTPLPAHKSIGLHHKRVLDVFQCAIASSISNTPYILAVGFCAAAETLSKEICFLRVVSLRRPTDGKIPRAKRFCDTLNQRQLWSNDGHVRPHLLCEQNKTRNISSINRDTFRFRNYSALPGAHQIFSTTSISASFHTSAALCHHRHITNTFTSDPLADEPRLHL